MVPRAVKLSVGVFLLVTSGRADLKLTPQVAEYELDGIKMRRLVFFDGPERVTYTPPADWECASTNENLLLLRPHGTRGEATIRRVDLARPETFDEETTKRLTEEVLFSVPRGATNVGLVSQQNNPLIIEGKETFLVIIKYDFYGEPQSRSVLFLDRKKDQMRFQLTSPRSNFQHLQEVFRSSYFSWQNL